MKKIVVMDNSRIVRQMVRRALEGSFEVVEARDGTDCLIKLFYNQDTALVLCEMSMPGIDGLALIEAFRHDPVYCKLPVVMLTTGQVELIVRARMAGAVGSIVKPFQPEVLLSVMKKLTILGQGDLLRAGPAAPGGPAAPTSPLDRGERLCSAEVVTQDEKQARRMLLCG